MDNPEIRGKVKLGCSSYPTPRTRYGFAEKGSKGE